MKRNGGDKKRRLYLLELSAATVIALLLLGYATITLTYSPSKIDLGVKAA